MNIFIRKNELKFRRLRKRYKMDNNQIIDYLELTDNEFKEAVIKEIVRLSEVTIDDPKNYILRRWEDETTAYGFNLRTIDVRADNVFKFWLELDKIFKEKSRVDLFDLVNWDIIWEEIEDGDEDMRYDLEKIVDFCFENFRTNDSLWYETY